MAFENREDLKLHFQTGGRPTQSQFENLLESILNFTSEQVASRKRVDGSLNLGIGYDPSNSNTIRDARLDINGKTLSDDLELTTSLKLAPTNFQINTSQAQDKVLIMNAVGDVKAVPQNQIIAGDDGDWTLLGVDMYSQNSGNIGIGTAVPKKKLHVFGDGLRVEDGNLEVISNKKGTGISVINQQPNGNSFLILGNAPAGSIDANINGFWSLWDSRFNTNSEFNLRWNKQSGNSHNYLSINEQTQEMQVHAPGEFRMIAPTVVDGHITVNGNASINSNLSVVGDANIDQKLTVPILDYSHPTQAVGRILRSGSNGIAYWEEPLNMDHVLWERNGNTISPKDAQHNVGIGPGTAEADLDVFGTFRTKSLWANVTRVVVPRTANFLKTYYVEEDDFIVVAYDDNGGANDPKGIAEIQLGNPTNREGQILFLYQRNENFRINMLYSSAISKWDFPRLLGTLYGTTTATGGSVFPIIPGATTNVSRYILKPGTTYLGSIRMIGIMAIGGKWVQFL